MAAAMDPNVAALQPVFGLQYAQRERLGVWAGPGGAFAQAVDLAMPGVGWVQLQVYGLPVG